MKTESALTDHFAGLQEIADTITRLREANTALVQIGHYIVACCEQEAEKVQHIGAQADIDRLVGTIAGAHVNIGINVEACLPSILAAIKKSEAAQ